MLLLRPPPPPLGGTRSPAAAEGGGISELAFERGGWRPGGALFGCGVGRRRGTEGGGIKEEVFAGAERVGGFGAGGSVGVVRDCGWDMVCKN